MFTEILAGLSLVLGQTSPAEPGKQLIEKAAEVVAPQFSPKRSDLLRQRVAVPEEMTLQYSGESSTPTENGKKNEDGNGNGEKEPKSGDNGLYEFLKPKWETGGFCYRFYKAYYEEFFPPPNQPETPEPARRAMASPWDSPPFPTNEYQGYPLLGIPYPDAGQYPIMKAIYGANTDWSEAIKKSRIQFTGWVTASGTWSTATNSNAPAAYWIVPNRYELDQLCFKLERVPDTVQTDHLDWGFRIITLYGMDYRFTAAGGWFSDQLLKHNLLYGWDPVEVYFNVYIPGFLEGTDIRVGRWIACPDIETQYSLDNYLGSHSLLFAVDTYTQTGIMLTQKLNQQWYLQLVIHAGTDMAPWYKGSLFTGAAGVRWVSKDNNDAVYAWLNAVNSAEFRHFEQYGQPLGDL